MKNIENLLNQTFVYDTIQDLEEKNKYLLEKIETFKKGITNILNDLYQSNYELKFKNKFIEEVLHLESLSLENDNQYENIENLLNQTFVYNTIQDLEEKNKYLLEKIENFKKSIKNLLKNWKKVNYDLEMKNKLIQVFKELQNSLSSFKDDSNDNKYEELENLKQENHRLSQNLIFKEKELENFEIDNKNYEEQIIDLNKTKQNLTDEVQSLKETKISNEEQIIDLNKTKQNLTKQLNKVIQEKKYLTDKLDLSQQQLDTITKAKQDLTDEVQSLKETKISNEEQIIDLNKTKQNLTKQLNKVIQEKKYLTDKLDLSQQQLDTITKAKQDLTDEVQSLKETKISNEEQIIDLNKTKQNLTKQLNKVIQEKKYLTDKLDLSQQQLDTITKAKQDLTDTLEESLLIKNSDYYQKLKYISEPIIISKHKDNNWNIETLPNIKDEKIEKTILLNIEENKILNNLIEQKNNITIIFCKKTKKFKEAFFIDKYQNKIIINIENEQQKILEKLNYKLRTEMASSLTQSDINKINNFYNQKEPKKSPCLTKEELKKYQNQGAVPKHYKLV